MGRGVRAYYNKVKVPKVLQIGLDTEERTTIDIAEKLINKQTIRRADITKCEFHPRFDKVRAFGAFECIDLQTAIPKCYDALKKGGEFEFTVQRDAPWIQWYRNWIRKPHKKDAYFKTKQYKIRTIKKWLRDVGFKDITHKLIDFRTIYYVKARRT